MKKNYLYLLLLLIIISCSQKEIEPQTTLKDTNKTVYVGGSGLHSLDAMTGKPNWIINNSYFFSSPVVKDDIIYIYDDYNLYSYDSNGKLKWSKKYDLNIFANPMIDKNILFIPGNDYYFYAINANDGSEKWKFKMDIDESSTPILNDNILYVGNRNGRVYAIEATTGKQIWKTSTNGSIQTDGIALENGIVYASSAGGTLSAFDAMSGSLKWKFNSGGIFISVVVNNGVAYLGSTNGIYAIDGKSGMSKWRSELKAGTNINFSEGFLYFGLDKKLYSLNAQDGGIKWELNLEGEAISSPTIANEVLYIGTYDDRKVIAINTLTGKLLWEYVTHSSVYSTPCVVTTKGDIYRACGNIRP